MIRITDSIALDPAEIEEHFVHVTAPGVFYPHNAATEVQLRFDLDRSPSLPDDVRARAARLAGHRLNKEGVVVITARRYASQDRNRADALGRLVELLRRAAEPEIPRRPTHPDQKARRRRLADKARRGALKRLRAPAIDEA